MGIHVSTSWGHLTSSLSQPLLSLSHLSLNLVSLLHQAKRRNGTAVPEDPYFSFKKTHLKHTQGMSTCLWTPKTPIPTLTIKGSNILKKRMVFNSVISLSLLSPQIARSGFKMQMVACTVKAKKATVTLNSLKAQRTGIRRWDRSGSQFGTRRSDLSLSNPDPVQP